MGAFLDPKCPRGIIQRAAVLCCLICSQIRCSYVDGQCRVGSGRQSLSQALVHAGTRLEQSHECTRSTDVDGTRATT